MGKWIDKMLGADKWRVVRSIWPYPEGYAVVKGYGEDKTIMSFGMTTGIK